MPIQYDFEHGVDTVFDLLTDPDYIVERCLDLGELEASCEVDQDGDVTIVEMRRKLHRDLPGFLARLMDPLQNICITEHWQADDGGGWTGEYVFEVEGQPVSIGAHFSLSSTTTGCRYLIQHKAKAKIPLVGRKVEQYVLTQAEEGCTDELDYLRDRLD